MATDHISSLLASRFPDLVCCMLCEYLVMASPTSHLKVFNATMTGKLMYCVPAWHGFRLAADYVQLDLFLRRV